MATASRISNHNPQTFSLLIIVVATILFAIAVFNIISLTERQNQKLIENELKIFLQGNGSFLKSGDQRLFAQKMFINEENYFLKVSNSIKKNEFQIGVESLSKSQGQCVIENYYEFNVLFCRPKPIPWNQIKIISLLFGIAILISLLILKYLNSQVLSSFRKIFQMAQIPHPEKLSFATAWKTASNMAEALQSFQKKSIAIEKNKTITEIASQVAHDIRSPLSALNMAMHTLTGASEEHKEVIKGSINRINDIANDLLNKSKEASTLQEATPHFNNLNETKQEALGSTATVAVTKIKPLVEQVIAEKRLELHHQNNLHIELDEDSSTETLVQLHPSDLARILSNLINNSVEALPESQGKITVGLRSYRDTVSLTVNDNGKGIPTEILPKLGEQKISYNKNHRDSGSGLGLYHAKKTIQDYGGHFQIQSQENVGTMIEIKLPRH